jgi:hypothetical protein
MRLLMRSRTEDALEILAVRHISGAPIVEADRVDGMLSAMDIIEFLAATPGVPDVTDADEDGEPRGIDGPAEAAAEESAAYFVDFWPDALNQRWLRHGVPVHAGGSVQRLPAIRIRPCVPVGATRLGNALHDTGGRAPPSSCYAPAGAVRTRAVCLRACNALYSAAVA